MTILKGEKIILRPIKNSDAQKFVKWLDDEEIRKFLNAQPKGISLKEEKKWIKSLSKNKTEKQFAICTKENKHIGSIGLHLDLKNRNANTGIMIGDKNYHGKDYGYEAMKLALNYGFRKLKLHRIDLNVYEYNTRAIKLYKKLGFKKEGGRREHVFWKNKFYDLLIMGLLQKEWFKNN